MKNIILVISIALSLAISGIVYGAVVENEATGVSVESLQRIRLGMSIEEVQEIIGREADSVSQKFSIITIPEIEIPPSYTHLWHGYDSAQIHVTFTNERVSSTFAPGLADALNYLVGPRGFTSRVPERTEPSIPWRYTGIALIPALVVVVIVYGGYGVYVLYNRTKPVIARDVTVTSRRSRRKLWGGFGNLDLLLTFRDVKTDEQIEKILPMRDEDLFNSVNIGARGTLKTQGALYISFDVDDSFSANQQHLTE